MRTDREHTSSPEAQPQVYDVVVVGYGGAGACAAIAAAERGARVLVIERFTGGGATARSGGVIYAGGGTRAQQEAGLADTPDMMFHYLARETQGSVSASDLRAFCGKSAELMDWIENRCGRVPGRVYRKKTTQPPIGYGLYVSGNEEQYGPGGSMNVSGQVPARGHVPSGAGMAGRRIYQALCEEAARSGVDVRRHTRPISLIIEDGSVTGVELLSIYNAPARFMHRFLFALGFVSPLARSLTSAFEEAFGTRWRVRARGGVVLCTGGFIYNRDMVKSLASTYAGCMPLGTPGDDGSGMLLGVSAGGDLAATDSCAASRFYAPPSAFLAGMLVNARGRRFCDESLYGATVSRHIAEQPGGRAWLIIDERIRREAKRQLQDEERLWSVPLRKILAGEMNHLIFRKTMAWMNLSFNRKKAARIEDLAYRCRIPDSMLCESVERYNRMCARGIDEDFNKNKDYLKPITDPPFYAIDCRIDSRLFPAPCITLGGLRVEISTGRVLRSDGSAVPGLYAAGRTAAGICARSYVSGLSLADCVFTGRAAGAAAADRAKEQAR